MVALLQNPSSMDVAQLGRELLVALVVAFSPLWVGFFASQLVSAYAIPSRSMDETLKVGDVVLAEKISSLWHLPLERGDLVFFSPPQELEEIVASSSGRRIGARDRFIKRVAAIPGDEVSLDAGGRGVRVNGVPRLPPPLACPPTADAEQTLPPPSTQPDSHAAVAAPVAAPAATAGVEQTVQSLVEGGRISADEGAALLREVAPPERETADGAAEEARRLARRRAFGGSSIEQRVVDPRRIERTTVVPASTGAAASFSIPTPMRCTP